jgi:hypothetical protein
MSFYQKLSTYNGIQNANATGSSYGKATSVSNVMIIPQFGNPGNYAISDSTETSCSGYRNITEAYGKNADNCNTKFVQRITQ